MDLRGSEKSRAKLHRLKVKTKSYDPSIAQLEATRNSEKRIVLLIVNPPLVLDFFYTYIYPNMEFWKFGEVSFYLNFHQYSSLITKSECK